jgi:hypothetical protein
MTKNELISKMRGRIDLCRRLARSTHDQRTAKVLLDIADEGERDLAQLIAEPHLLPSLA